MQKMVKQYIAEEVKRLHIKGRVLEIGSLDVNGNLNDELKHCDHVRLDMREGKNVDIVANAHDLPFEANSFDAVICVDVFEHDSAFWVTMREIDRVLKSKGAIVLAASGLGFPHHSHPYDYWRFTKYALAELLKEYDNVEVKADDTKLKKPDTWESFGSGSKK
jgi:SAM-dependent methyltransferase